MVEDAVMESHKGMKVRDNCHFTGKYRGAAHSKCNIQYRKIKDIPVFFHNLGGYDGHLIFQNLSKIEGIKEPGGNCQNKGEICYFLFRTFEIQSLLAIFELTSS